LVGRPRPFFSASEAAAAAAALEGSFLVAAALTFSVFSTGTTFLSAAAGLTAFSAFCAALVGVFAAYLGV
jgi:hypothetical protein